MARACTLSSVRIALNGVTGPKWYHAHATGIYCGYLVDYQDYESVIVMAAAGLGLGVAGLPSYKDNTAEYAANERVPVWVCGSGVEVWATTDGANTVTWKTGDFVECGGTAGLCLVDAAISAHTMGRVARGFDEASAAKNFRLLLNF